MARPDPSLWGHVKGWISQTVQEVFISLKRTACLIVGMMVIGMFVWMDVRLAFMKMDVAMNKIVLFQ